MDSMALSDRHLSSIVLHEMVFLWRMAWMNISGNGSASTDVAGNDKKYPLEAEKLTRTVYPRDWA